MNRAALLMTLLLFGGVARSADEIEPLDGDFLEYLANLEGDDDDWTLLAEAEKDRSPPPSQADAQASKPSKEAAKPAPDER